MTNLLVDTCVWLDIAKNQEQHSLLTVIEDLCKAKEIRLLVPEVVIKEFQRNKERVIKDSGKSVVSNLKRTQELFAKHAKRSHSKSLNRLLNRLDFQSPVIVAAAGSAVLRIERLLKKGLIIDSSDKIKLAAVQRAIEGKAPFHKSKNSVNDAIIIETYISQVIRKDSIGHRYMFVTHNKNDFSDLYNNENLPHPDLQEFFTKIKSQYHVKLTEAIRRIRPDIISELMLNSESTFEPRSLDEISKNENILFEKRWYDRHKMFSRLIAEGKIKGHSKDETNHEGNAFAKQIEKKYGIENLGPWTDFDWGMISGKHSALRWVLGEEWDMLDT